MRIRTIKPEFWTSEDIAALDWDARLIFIGLWSYVDDNGVGRDVEKLILADLFPLEDDARETLARLSRGLQALVAGGQITRYEVDGKRYLYVNAWGHQKIDHPSRGGCYPLPTSENAVIRPDDDPPSGDTRETVAPVPGYRGTGVPGDSATRAEPAAPPPLPIPASETEGQRVNRLTKTYTDRVPLSKFPAVAGVVRQAVRAVDERSNPRYDDPQLIQALTRLAAEGRSVTVDSLRYELEGFPRQSKAPVSDERAALALAAGAEVQAMLDDRLGGAA